MQQVVTNRSSSLQVSVSVLLIFAIASAVYYGSFLFDRSHIDNIYLYAVLIFIELYVILQTVGLWWTVLCSDYNPRDHAYAEHRKSLIRADQITGGIDVFVTVYGEDLAMIADTVQAAKEMSVEHHTYILDDGKSDDVKQLASELGVGYIRRETNKGFKAGNINNALKLTDSKYVVIFDADHQPKKNFLIETIPFFHDKTVAFVQTPQSYSNRNSLIAKGASDSQRVFYDVVFKGKNKFSSSFWVGTNAVFRRVALESVGGVVSHASEDIFTAYLLHQKGWKSLYIPDVLAVGTAPSELGAYFNQQLRWARGGLALFFHDNPLFKKLSVDQKIQYFLSGSFYFNGVVLAAMILLPLLYLFLDIKPLVASSFFEWALHYLPFFLLQFVTVFVFTGKLSWEAYVLSINTFPVYVKAFFTVISGGQVEWRATSAVSNAGRKSTLYYLQPHLVILFFSILAVPFSLINVTDSNLTILSLVWVCINAITVGAFIVSTLSTRHSK